MKNYTFRDCKTIETNNETLKASIKKLKNSNNEKEFDSNFALLKKHKEVEEIEIVENEDHFKINIWDSGNDFGTLDSWTINKDYTRRTNKWWD